MICEPQTVYFYEVNPDAERDSIWDSLDDKASAYRLASDRPCRAQIEFADYKIRTLDHSRDKDVTRGTIQVETTELSKSGIDPQKGMRIGIGDDFFVITHVRPMAVFGGRVTMQEIEFEETEDRLGVSDVELEKAKEELRIPGGI
jgi:hypothetical protein